MDYEELFEDLAEAITDAITQLKPEHDIYAAKHAFDIEAEEYANILVEYTHVTPTRTLQPTDYGPVVRYDFHFHDCDISIMNTQYGDDDENYEVMTTISVKGKQVDDFEMEANGWNKTIKTCQLRDAIAKYVKIDF